MPVYVEKLIHYFQHNPPPKMQHQPHPYVPPKYGAKTKYSTPLNDSKLLDKEGNQFIIELTGTFLFLFTAVNRTMLTELSTIIS